MTFAQQAVRVALVVACGIALAALIAVWPQIRAAISRRVDHYIAGHVDQALTDPRYAPDGDYYDRILREHRPVPGPADGRRQLCLCGAAWPCIEVALRPEEVERLG